MFKYKLYKLREKTLIKIAWKMPRKLAYWCAIRLMTNATTGEYANQIVPELTALNALDRWERR